MDADRPPCDSYVHTTTGLHRSQAAFEQRILIGIRGIRRVYSALGPYDRSVTRQRALLGFLSQSPIIDVR